MAKKVLVGGTFDIVHVGHIEMLKQAKNLCDDCRVIVVVARDSTIRRYKRREPIIPEEDRLKIISAIKYVDEAILGNEIDGKTFYDIILDVKPDIVALGYDQRIEEKNLQEWIRSKGLETKVVRLKKYVSSSGINSSSDIRQKIIELFCGDNLSEQ